MVVVDADAGGTAVRAGEVGCVVVAGGVVGSGEAEHSLSIRASAWCSSMVTVKVQPCLIAIQSFAYEQCAAVLGGCHRSGPAAPFAWFDGH